MPPDRRLPELGPAYAWIDTPEGSFLQFHKGCAAYVKPLRDPPRFKGVDYQVTIHWKGREVRGVAGSIEQGKRSIARWILGREAGRGTAPRQPARTRKTERGVAELLAKGQATPRAVIVPRAPEFDLTGELPAIPVFEDFLAALDSQARAIARHHRGGQR